MKSSSRKNQDICKMLLYAVLALIFVNMLMNIMEGRSCFDMGVLKNVGAVASPSPSPTPPATTNRAPPMVSVAQNAAKSTPAPASKKASPPPALQKKPVASKSTPSPTPAIKKETQPVTSQRVLENEKMGPQNINNPEGGLSMMANVLDGASKFVSDYALWDGGSSAKPAQQQNQVQARPVGNGKVNQSALNALTGNGDVNKAQNGGTAKAPVSTGPPAGTGRPVRNTMMANNAQDSAAGFAAAV